MLAGIDAVQVVVIAVAVAIVLFALWRAHTTPKRRVASITGQDLGPSDRIALENELRKTNFEVIGATLLVVGVAFTYLQLQATRAQLDLTSENQASERLAKAIGQIGSDRQAEQVGGMYGLRNLAIDAAAEGDTSYYGILDQTLSAFIRQRVACGSPCLPRPETPDTREDHHTVQIALSILGNRDRRLDRAQVMRTREHLKLDLRDLDLRRAQLRDLHLVRVDFQGSNLSMADFTNADLDGSDLRAVVLHDAQNRDSAKGDIAWP